MKTTPASKEEMEAKWVVTQGAHTALGKEFAVWQEGHIGNGEKLVASWIKSEAHAHLIAAAPALYAALTKLRPFVAICDIATVDAALALAAPKKEQQ